jgi:hypothetical protein
MNQIIVEPYLLRKWGETGTAPFDTGVSLTQDAWFTPKLRGYVEPNKKRSGVIWTAP